ncbi:MAG: DDE-type integrase/transposase/recombinase [Candidatus Aerophobetes bacterium]|nr:DDE-type integrase/transposase/recombinase [Candidatus Aerophobetes bacterium]
MIREKMYEKVQLFKRRGYSRSEITSELELDPKTAAKYYAMDGREFKTYRREHMFRDRVFEEYEKDILEVYKMNEFGKLNMSAVYDYLEEKYGTLAGNEQTLRNYIEYLIQTDKLRLNEKIRLYTRVPELPFGRQIQLDFGQYRCRSGLKLYIFACLLSASRYKYVNFQDHPFRTKEVICHLLNCFDYFGGVAKEIVIDQDNLMVVSENAGDIIYTDDFKYFIEEQGIRMYVCRAADPETKGKIENLIKYVKHNLLSIRDFKSVDEANESGFKWLKRRANEKISQATKQIPALLVNEERKHLKPLGNSIFRKNSLIGREKRSASEKAYISVEASSYQLPLKYRDKTVEIYLTKHKLFVFDLYTGEKIIEYELSPIPGRILSKREYGRETEKTAQELKALVYQMFELKNWKSFTAKNFKTFSRYVRDQCLEAKRYFLAKDIDLDILEQALKYCLKNDTLSFSNLNDTYAYFKRTSQGSNDIIKEIPTLDRKHQGAHEPLGVTERSLSVYKELVGKGKGALI